MNKLRQIPAIDELQKDESFQALLPHMSKEKLTAQLQIIVANVRQLMIDGKWDEKSSTITSYIFNELRTYVHHIITPMFRRVINGTGTVLHTNLGRARLSERAICQVVETAQSYSNLEYNLQTGTRGSRHDLIERLIIETTGAEAAIVVNNNAAAVYLVLKAFAKDKEVIVSRGELIEIGGSFRISSIMEESGAHLVEVGTTNKTHVYDYEQAITEKTAIIMKVHTSNFKVIGFTEEVTTNGLHLLAKQHDVLLYEDLGSGLLYDFKKVGIGEEPTVAEALQNGAHIVSFSGDKLLGGPQAGIIAGKKEYIDKLKKHQLARVLRVDKMTLAALEATLRQYVQNGEERIEIPTIRSVLLTKDEVLEKINRFSKKLCSQWQIEIEESYSQVGGGTMPAVQLPTYILCLTHKEKKTKMIYNELRTGIPAVVSRIIDDRIAFDFRTIDETDFQLLHERLAEFN